MHILFTAYEFVTEHSPCGGFGHYLSNIASILASHGHKVTILLSANVDKVYFWKPNIEIVSFRYKFSGYSSEAVLDVILGTDMAEDIDRSKRLKEEIIKIHKRDRIDLIQYNGDRLEGWHRIWGIPTVIRLSSIGAWYDQGYNINKSMNDYSWLYNRKMSIFLVPLIMADAVYAPSKIVASIVNKRLRRKIDVIESPYCFKTMGYINEDKYGIFEKKYVLYLGRICLLKGMNTVINSIYQMLDDDKDLYIVFAGYVENPAIVRKTYMASREYSDRVKFLGEVKEKACVQTIINHAYACIFPSRADNLSNSCIECMGQGKIVVGSYGASYEQLIQHKTNGLLIKRDDAGSLEKAIQYINRMTNEQRAQMGICAKQTIQRLSPEEIYPKLISLYNSIINK